MNMAVAMKQGGSKSMMRTRLRITESTGEAVHRLDPGAQWIDDWGLVTA